MTGLRVLFLSGVSDGGAPVSTLGLAERLSNRGHTVTVLVQVPGREERAVDWLTRAWVKAATRFSLLSRLLRLIAAPLGARIRVGSTGNPTIGRAGHVANAARRIMRKHDFDVVVANSIARAPMQWLANDCRRSGTPVVIYMREEHAVTHLEISRLPVDGVVGNAREWVDRATAAGYPAEFFPSTVALEPVETTREAVLFVNPVPENRPEVFIQTARLCPQRRFVLQESWLLGRDAEEKLARQCEGVPNLEYRKRVDGGLAELYQDTWVLWAPYPTGRPRVVLEAQFNGIPVLAADQPALVEAVGPGGLVVPAESEAARWAEAVRSLEDADTYEELSEAASAHARRPEVDPDQIVAGFENYLHGIVQGSR